MKLRRLLSLCAVIAVSASTLTGFELGASAATQVGTTYNYTGTANSASANDNSKISPYLDDKWTIPTDNTRGIMTRQDTKAADGSTTDGDFGKCFTGAKNHYSFKSGVEGNIVYYTFDIMADRGGFGSVAVNGHRLDGNSYKDSNNVSYPGVKLSGEYNTQYNPHTITVIADTLNNRAYYCSTAQTGQNGQADIVLGNEAAQLDIGNRYDNNNNRYFFKNFSYGTIEYELSGADTVTAGSSEEYAIQETGTSLGVNFKPEKQTYELASEIEGISIYDGTLSVEETVADNTEITINAKINGTTAATKTVTVSNPLPKEDMLDITGVDAYISDNGTGNIRFVTTVNSDEEVSEYGTWLVSADSFTGDLELVDSNKKQELSGNTAGVKTTFGADIVNISADKFDAPYFAISYIKIGDITAWSKVRSAAVNDYAHQD